MSQTVYVDRKFIKITNEKKQLVFHTQEGHKSSLPFRLIDRLIIHGHCLIDTYLLGKLSENNITTVLFCSIKSRQMAIIHGIQHNDANIHIKQYEFYKNNNLTLIASKKLIKAKALRQYRWVKKIKSKKPQHRKKSFDAEKAILQLIKTIDAAKDKQQLLGIEGYIAKQYFSIFTQVFSDSLNFTVRNKRPPKDPVNAVLSLSYTIYSARCSQALIKVGLDPLIGFNHKIVYARQSLALDMMEPWRPLIDQFILQLFNNNILKKKYFFNQGPQCLLNKQGRAIFYTEFERKMRIWQKGIDHMARLMVRELNNQIIQTELSTEENRPF